MVQTRRVLVVAAFLAATLAMAAKDGITLRKALVTGTENYHTETTAQQTITMPGSADQQMKFTSVSASSYHIGVVDSTAGQAPVEVTTHVEKFDSDGPLASFLTENKDKILVTTTATGKLDTLNRYKADNDKKSDPLAILNGMATNALVGPYFEFPEGPVNVGDTWDITIPKGPTTAKVDQKLSAKLIGDKVVDGKSVYVVTINGQIKTDVNLSNLLQANPIPALAIFSSMQVNFTASTDVTGEVLVDKSNGQTVQLTCKLVSTDKLEIPDQSLTIPSTGTSDIKVTLDK